ncbi:MAG: DUF4097 family beta strand repeat-containing protein [Steroidobacteraceae bacterium]
MSNRISIAAATILLAITLPAAASQNLSKRANVAADVAVEVSNVEGRVDVTAWDRNEVELSAWLESDKDQLEFEATDRQVRIKVVRPNRRSDDADEAILTLKIPKGARLSTQTVSADISVSGVLGEQRLGTVSGDARTEAHDAPVRLQTVSGDGTISGKGGKAAVTVESVSGEIIATGIRGSYDGEVVSGGLTIGLEAGERLAASSISGDIDAQVELMPTARVEMETVSGTIKLTTKPPVNAEFELESFSGDIGVCFGPQARDKNRYGPGSELNFSHGSGGARVSIESLSGDIRICDR